MATLKEEEAFAFALDTDYLNSTCSFCFKDQNKVHKCKGCHVVSYCGRQCQKGDWESHKNECRLLQQWKTWNTDLPDDFVRLAARILFMSKEKLAQKAFNGRSWDSLMDHLADERSLPEGFDHDSFFNKVDILNAFLRPTKKLCPEELERTLSKILTNAVSGRDTRTGKNVIGVCIFLGLSVHNHSCLPDGMWIVEGTKCSFRSLKPNAVYSSELTVSYIRDIDDFTDYHKFRRERLRRTWYFNCTCELCSNKNHIINRMGESCYVSCCKDGAGVLDEFGNGPYKCNKCGKVSPIIQEQVETAHTNLDRLMTKAYEPCRILSKFKKHRKILSLFNYRMIDLCKELIPFTGLSNMPLSLQLQEAITPAYRYYFPEGHVEKAYHEIDVAVTKGMLGNPDAYISILKANEEVKRSFGGTVGGMTKNLKTDQDAKQIVELLKGLLTSDCS